jgi:hypothetical protein
MLDGVGMIQAQFLEELFEVVRGLSCLALAVANGPRGMFRAGAACLLIDATIVIGCHLLMVLFAPLLGGLNAFLGTLDGDIRWCFPATAWGRLKLGHPSAGGVRGGVVAPSLDSASGGIV